MPAPRMPRMKLNRQLCDAVLGMSQYLEIISSLCSYATGRRSCHARRRPSHKGANRKGRNGAGFSPCRRVSFSRDAPPSEKPTYLAAQFQYTSLALDCHLVFGVFQGRQLFARVNISGVLFPCGPIPEEVVYVQVAVVP